MLTKRYLDELTYEIVGGAMEVHKELGRGLLESIYTKCLMHELCLREIDFVSEMMIPVNFKGVRIDASLRLDLYVCDCMVVEIKAVEKIAPIHEAQLLTYMKLLQAPKGILLKFNCINLFKEGQKTFVSQHFANLP